MTCIKYIWPYSAISSTFPRHPVRPAFAPISLVLQPLPLHTKYYCCWTSLYMCSWCQSPSSQSLRRASSLGNPLSSAPLINPPLTHPLTYYSALNKSPRKLWPSCHRTQSQYIYRRPKCRNLTRTMIPWTAKGGTEREREQNKFPLVISV